MLPVSSLLLLLLVASAVKADSSSEEIKSRVASVSYEDSKESGGIKGRSFGGGHYVSPFQQHVGRGPPYGFDVDSHEQGYGYSPHGIQGYSNSHSYGRPHGYGSNSIEYGGRPGYGHLGGYDHDSYEHGYRPSGQQSYGYNRPAPIASYANQKGYNRDRYKQKGYRPAPVASYGNQKGYKGDRYQQKGYRPAPVASYANQKGYKGDRYTQKGYRPNPIASSHGNKYDQGDRYSPNFGYNSFGNSHGHNSISSGYQRPGPHGVGLGYNGPSQGYSAHGQDIGFRPTITGSGYNHNSQSQGYGSALTGAGYNPYGQTQGYQPSAISAGFNPLGQGFRPSAISAGYNPHGQPHPSTTHGSGFHGTGQGSDYGLNLYRPYGHQQSNGYVPTIPSGIGDSSGLGHQPYQSQFGNAGQSNHGRFGKSPPRKTGKKTVFPGPSTS